jgi:hypothetical protein
MPPDPLRDELRVASDLCEENRFPRAADVLRRAAEAPAPDPAAAPGEVLRRWAGFLDALGVPAEVVACLRERADVEDCIDSATEGGPVFGVPGDPWRLPVRSGGGEDQAG